MSIANELVKAVYAAQDSSKRTRQTEVGPSEVGGCSRALWNRMNGVELTNHNTIRFPAAFGSAIHAYFQDIFHRLDPFEEKYLIEKEWRSDAYEMVGHIDLYDIEKKEVIDWKSSTKKNFGGGYFPSKQQRWQIHLYGLLVEENGREVQNVTLVGIPRDGNERDILVHTEPYDKNIALEALKWLELVRQTSIPPAPERDASFCANYCGFYDATGKVGCTGRPKEQAEGALIDDPNVVSMTRDYLRIGEQIKQLEEQKDAIKAQLEGVNGVTPDGNKIIWSKIAGRKSLDSDLIEYFYELHGESVPYKQSDDSFRLTVKRG